MFFIGFIVPIIPIPLYEQCSEKDIYVYIYIRRNDFNKVDVGNYLLVNINNIEMEIKAELLSYPAKPGFIYKIPIPIICQNWQDLKIKIDDIYIKGIKQKPIEFEVKKKFKAEFFYLGS
jgi:hypothetical protein